MLSFAAIWVVVFLPLPWLVRRLCPPVSRDEAAVRVPFGSRLRAAAGASDGVATRVVGDRGGWLRWLIWLSVLAALARPQWIEPPITKQIPTRDLLLLVDLSSSMQQEDFQDQSGKQVDRLTAVKGVVGEFVERREGDRVGLVVFGDSPFLQAPFSMDLNLTRGLLDECAIGMAGPRTALGDAIGLGVNLFEGSDVPAKTIIALTDGNDTKSQVPPVEAARVAAQEDIRVHSVAIGDPTTTGEEKLDEQTLRDVAAAAGGSYFFAADRDSLDSIYAQLDEIETRDLQVDSYRPRRDVYYVPLTLALAIWVFGMTAASLRRRQVEPQVPVTRRVHVNTATGELEVSP